MFITQAETTTLTIIVRVDGPSACVDQSVRESYEYSAQSQVNREHPNVHKNNIVYTSSDDGAREYIKEKGLLHQDCVGDALFELWKID